MREATDALIEKVDSSIERHKSNLSHNSDSTPSTEMNNPTEQNFKSFEDETFSRGGKYSLRPKRNLNVSDYYRY